MMELSRGEDGMTRNLIVLGCAVLLAFGLSFGTFAGVSPDSDSDGVPDAFDNCTNTPNGPLLGTGLCVAQEDNDGDGYGNPCDTDLNNDFGVGLDDAAIALANQGNGAGDVADVNCDTGVGLDDAAEVLGTQGATPGPSGLVCAGSAPCSAQ
jgi:hypothetical protein